MALQVAHDSSHSSQVLIICGLIIATVMFYGHSGNLRMFMKFLSKFCTLANTLNIGRFNTHLPN
jgi:hypothetical protein